MELCLGEYAWSKRRQCQILEGAMRSEKDAGDGHEHDSDVARASISPTEVVTLLA